MLTDEKIDRLMNETSARIGFMHDTGMRRRIVARAIERAALKEAAEGAKSVADKWINEEHKRAWQRF